jgi:hypothetical protein
MIIARFDDNGRYVSVAEASIGSMQFENPQRVHIGFVDSATQYHDLATDEPVNIPERPSSYHVFDWPTHTWVADLDAIRTAKRQAIEAQREALIYAPLIVYDGKTLDAEARSQRNITEKLNDITRREQESDPMPAEMLMWRDADNVDTYSPTRLPTAHG